MLGDTSNTDNCKLDVMQLPGRKKVDGPAEKAVFRGENILMTGLRSKAVDMSMLDAMKGTYV